MIAAMDFSSASRWNPITRRSATLANALTRSCSRRPDATLRC